MKGLKFSEKYGYPDWTILNVSTDWSQSKWTITYWVNIILYWRSKRLRTRTSVSVSLQSELFLQQSGCSGLCDITQAFGNKCSGTTLARSRLIIVVFVLIIDYCSICAVCQKNPFLCLLHIFFTVIHWSKYFKIFFFIHSWMSLTINCLIWAYGVHDMKLMNLGTSYLGCII